MFYFYIETQFLNWPHHCLSELRIEAEIFENSNSFLHFFDSWLDDSQQTFVLMKTSWRRPEDLFRLRLQKTSSRRLQDVFIKTNIFPLFISLQKRSSRRLEDVLIKTNILVLVIRLQDVLKTFSKHLQDAFKTSSRRLQNVFRTSSRRFEDVFKTFSRRIIKLNCSC